MTWDARQKEEDKARVHHQRSHSGGDAPQWGVWPFSFALGLPYTGGRMQSPEGLQELGRALYGPYWTVSNENFLENVLKFHAQLWGVRPQAFGPLRGPERSLGNEPGRPRREEPARTQKDTRGSPTLQTRSTSDSQTTTPNASKAQPMPMNIADEISELQQRAGDLWEVATKEAKIRGFEQAEQKGIETEFTALFNSLKNLKEKFSPSVTAEEIRAIKLLMQRGVVTIAVPVAGTSSSEKSAETASPAKSV